MKATVKMTFEVGEPEQLKAFLDALQTKMPIGEVKVLDVTEAFVTNEIYRISGASVSTES